MTDLDALTPNQLEHLIAAAQAHLTELTTPLEPETFARAIANVELLDPDTGSEYLPLFKIRHAAAALVVVARHPAEPVRLSARAWAAEHVSEKHWWLIDVAVDEAVKRGPRHAEVEAPWLFDPGENAQVAPAGPQGAPPVHDGESEAS